VLKLFDPEIRPDKILPKYRRPERSEYLGHGEIRRRCREALRDREVITAEEIALATMRDKGLDPDEDRRLRSDFIKRTLRALDALRRNGSVEKIGNGRGVRWKLAERKMSPL
jgi:hypothetical protein